MVRTVGNNYALALDIVSFAVCFYGGYDCFYGERVLPPHLIEAGQWQFLTNLTLAYSLVVFALGAVAHATKSQSLYNLKNNLHPVGLALESVVAIVYWPLRIFLLHLLVKDPTKMALPLLTDLSVHLMPVASLLIDFLAFMPQWSFKKSSAFGTCAILTTAYWFWLHHIVDLENGAEFPYEFLNHPSVYVRLVIFALVGLTGFSLYLVLSNVYIRVVGKEKVE